MATQADQLRAVKNFDDLLLYLEEELDWPLQEYGYEELTFEYTPEELGLKEDDIAKVRSIRQLRPLQYGQPWGIFFVEFERKRLPIVVMRRILSHLVVKKRASQNRADAAAWQTSDLLFISAFGAEETDQREIAFAHFHQEDGDLPTLRVLGWDGADTPLKLEHVAATLHEKLRWPDDPTAEDAWRVQWSSAFRHRPGQVIRTADALADALATLARNIREAAQTLLDIESEDGRLRTLHKSFQTALIHDLTEEDFADTYAQTITYGLLTAAISRTEMSEGRHGTVLSPDDMAAIVPVTNPFLKEMLQTFLKAGGRQGGIDFDELGIQEVVALLRGDATDLPAILRDFGNKTQGEDPVIHFYEHFLAAYDKQLKVQRGVFYTPKPVVSYIVRSVHELLQREFGLADGLADTTTWGEMARRLPGLKIPEGTDPNSPFVVILDIATGTATFLVEVIDVIYRTMMEKWRRQGLSAQEQNVAWNAYVPENLLTRLYGYELMMAPYAIAHMKIGLKLYETGFDAWDKLNDRDRVHIYLTNTLESTSQAQEVLAGILPALAHEASAVNLTKQVKYFTIVLGNPPYSNYSANLTPGARKLVDKYRRFRGSLIRERNQLQFERNIQDDFVKFFSVAEDLIQKSQIGILGFITNQSMLTSASLRGMREHLCDTFQLIYEMNLHGGANELITGVEADQNVFEIIQAVGIHLYVRCSPHTKKGVYYNDLTGNRPKKYATLSLDSVTSTVWQPIKPDADNCSFVPQNVADISSLTRFDAIFVKFGAGIKTNRDAIAINFDKERLKDAVFDYRPQLRTDLTSDDSHIKPILYRPFDVRHIFYHQDIVASRSLPTMRHIITGNNIGLIASSTWTTPDRFSTNISRLLVEMKTGTHDRGTTFFPLYRYESMFGQKPQPVCNLTTEFIGEWVKRTATEFLPSGSGDMDITSGPEDVLYWLYGLSYSPAYRTRYKSFLAQGFPIAILTSRKPLLKAIIRYGHLLASLHLAEFAFDNEIDAPENWPRVAQISRFRGENKIVAYLPGAVRAYKKGFIAINGESGFEGVPEGVWNFHIGGYQVCHKWLKDRKDRTLSDEDILHYAKIVTALHETIRIMDEIDAVIDEHGGWPLE